MHESERGKFRVTTFGDDGPVGHHVEPSMEKVAEEIAVGHGYKSVRPASDDEVMAWTSTSKFIEGSKRVAFTQAANMLNFRAGKQDKRSQAREIEMRAHKLASEGHWDDAVDVLQRGIKDLGGVGVRIPPVATVVQENKWSRGPNSTLLVGEWQAWVDGDGHWRVRGPNPDDEAHYADGDIELTEAEDTEAGNSATRRKMRAERAKKAARAYIKSRQGFGRAPSLIAGLDARPGIKEIATQVKQSIDNQIAVNPDGQALIACDAGAVQRLTKDITANLSMAIDSWIDDALDDTVVG